MTALSIIIVTYNPGEVVLDCLRSIQKDVGDLGAQVIVVDNASQDGTPERIRREFPQVQVIANIQNRGFAAANNQGMALAEGRYILLLNPDAIIHPNALAAMIAFMDNNPKVGIVGPRTLDAEGKASLSVHPSLTVLRIVWEYWGLHWLFPGMVSGRYQRTCREAKQPIEVEVVYGSCLMLRRTVYEQIGGLDEGFFLFCEEDDLCERARASGWRVYYLPGAAVTHYESSTVSRYTPIRVRHYHLSPLYYFRKRRREGAVLALKIGFSVELVAKIVIRLFQLIWHRDQELALRLRTYKEVLGEVWRY